MFHSSQDGAGSVTTTPTRKAISGAMSRDAHNVPSAPVEVARAHSGAAVGLSRAAPGTGLTVIAANHNGLDSIMSNDDSSSSSASNSARPESRQVRADTERQASPSKPITVKGSRSPSVVSLSSVTSEASSSIYSRVIDHTLRQLVLAVDGPAGLQAYLHAAATRSSDIVASGVLSPSSVPLADEFMLSASTELNRKASPAPSPQLSRPPSTRRRPSGSTAVLAKDGLSSSWKMSDAESGSVTDLSKWRLVSEEHGVKVFHPVWTETDSDHSALAGDSIPSTADVRPHASPAKHLRSSYDCVKATGVVQASPLDILALLREPANRDKYDPLCSSSRVVQRIDDHTVVAHITSMAQNW